jgi:hypothetical protein
VKELAELSRTSAKAAAPDARADLDRVLAQLNLRTAVTSAEWRDGRASLVFAAIGYDTLIGLIEALQRDARLRVVEATITARVEPMPCAPNLRRALTSARWTGRRPLVLLAMVAIAAAVVAWLAPAALGLAHARHASLVAGDAEERLVRTRTSPPPTPGYRSHGIWTSAFGARRDAHPRPLGHRCGFTARHFRASRESHHGANADIAMLAW